MPHSRIWQSPPIDEVSVRARVAKLGTRSIKEHTKTEGLNHILSMIDLTTLEGADTADKVKMLCQKARQPIAGRDDIGPVAAVCVYPPMVPVAKAALEGTNINVAAVATYFPSGHATLEERVAEVEKTVALGADEIDMVISRRDFLEGRFDKVYEDIAQIVKACGPAHLKVILETGELGTLENVRLASDIAMEAGAHFIKTSTGKISPAATLPVTLVMLEAIRDYYKRTGRMVGMKPAGGIRDTKTALRYLVVVKETLGDAWLDPDWFRFGASSLLNDVLMQLEKGRTGVYQSDRYFSIS